MTIKQGIPRDLQKKLRMLNIKPETLELVPEEMARKYHIIPLELKAKKLSLAMVDPTDIIAIDTLASQSGMFIAPEVASAEDIQEAIDFHYGPPEEESIYESDEELEEIERQLTRITGLATTNEDQSLPTEEIDSPIVRVLSLVLNDAVRNGVSDVHFQPQKRELLIRYRIDGALHDVMSLPIQTAPAIVSRIKILANLNIADHRHPQDGQFVIERNERKGQKVRTDIRVGILPSIHGEIAALRLHDNSKVIMDLSQLGFSQENLSLYQEMLQVPHGMILVSGPTGAGKTTTLYSSINNLDCQQKNIFTIEDPIEYDFHHITQIQTNLKADLTFASGLRSILRTDPDVILIGEIRDSETAKIAIQSALTGHLVLSSIHATDTIGVITRLLEFNIEPFLIASALVGVISQRMVRQICPNCANKVEGTSIEKMAYAKETGQPRSQFLSGAGCELCNSGYRGRTGIFEILRISDEIRAMIVNQSPPMQLQDQAIKEGLKQLMKAGMLKVKENLTTPSEVLRNAYSI